MTEKDFCYWLQGFFEMTEADVLSQKQVLMIREHLALVFNKVTSSIQDDYEVDDGTPKSQGKWIEQNVSNDLHKETRDLSKIRCKSTMNSNTRIC